MIGQSRVPSLAGKNTWALIVHLSVWKVQKMPVIDDLCVEKKSLDKVIERDPSLAELFDDDRGKKSPEYKCFICDGYNYNCNQYKLEVRK